MNNNEETLEINGLHLLADTNLFFEFKKLNELPWEDLNADPIIILISKPVLDEIDKHKKIKGRTRNRAIEIFKMLRNSLKTGGTDTTIREASPRVLLRHIGNLAPDEKLNNQLDYQKNDDRLVGILSTLITKKNLGTVELFTDDTGPVSTANGLGLPFRFIEDDWRRPAEQTSEIKLVKELEKELAKYRSQEPNIKIQHDETIENGAVKTNRRVAIALTSSGMDNFIKRLKLKHPLQNNFSPPTTKTIRNPLNGAKTEYSYEAPDQEDIDHYREVAYPKWIEDCKVTINKLPDILSSPEQATFVSWAISNVGTRPASQVRIEFKAEGPVALFRTQNDENEDNDGNSTEVIVPQRRDGLPKPPSPPTIKETQKEITPPKSVASKRLYNTRLNDLGTSLKGFDIGSAALRATQANLGESLFLGNALKDFQNSGIQKILKDQHSLFDRINPLHTMGLQALSNPTFEHVIPNMDHVALHPIKDDPEAFYFRKWKTDIPVKLGALTCDLWRHQKGIEEFEFEVIFSKDDDVKGAILCTIHAENLTTPATSRIKVSRTIEEFSVLDEALAMIDEI